MAVDSNRIRDLKILVVGDMIVDHYRNLCPKRISPEAPVIIYEPQTEEWIPGGAGNVASNLLAMGVCNVVLASVVGPDWEEVSPYKYITGRKPSQTLVIDESRRTTVKERLITSRQQLARIDIQSNQLISTVAAQELLTRVSSLVLDSDVIVFSDYDHGVMVQPVVSSLIALSKSLVKPTVVDSKSKDLAKYKNATIALPNHIEAALMTNMSGSPKEAIARRLLDEMKLDAVGMTLGPDGILLMRVDGVPKRFPSLGTSELVVDVTGAGDTVTAAVAIGLGTGMTYDDAMVLANVAAGVVVQKRGVATTTLEEVLAAAKAYGVVL